MDPRGLTYQRGGPSPDPSSRIDINFDGELGETSDVDSHTTIQDNPLKYRLATARQNGVGDIQIETAVVPYDDNYNDYQNTNMRTFHVEEISSNSDTSDSTGDSNKILMEKHRKTTSGNTNSLSWAGSNPPSSTFGSDVSTQYINNPHLDQMLKQNIAFIQMKFFLTHMHIKELLLSLTFLTFETLSLFAEEINDDVLSLSVGNLLHGDCEMQHYNMYV